MKEADLFALAGAGAGLFMTFLDGDGRSRAMHLHLVTVHCPLTGAVRHYPNARISVKPKEMTAEENDRRDREDRYHQFDIALARIDEIFDDDETADFLTPADNQILLNCMTQLERLQKKYGTPAP